MRVSLPPLFLVLLWRKVRLLYYICPFLSNLYQMYKVLPDESGLETPLGTVLADSRARLTPRWAHHWHSLSLVLLQWVQAAFELLFKNRFIKKADPNNCLRNSDWILCAIKFFQNCCLPFPIPLIITSFFLGTNMFFKLLPAWGSFHKAHLLILC